MNTVFEDILKIKRIQVAKNKERLSLRTLMDQCSTETNPPSFISAIQHPDKVSIIAEIKKASPSAGFFFSHYNPIEIAKSYAAAGASALSILTEENFFGGSIQDLIDVKHKTELPILRKDFIVDPYQVYESKVIGASAILLIMAALTESSYLELTHLAEKLDLDVLVEIHSKEELLAALKGNPKIIGINNRNLKDLSVNLAVTFELVKWIPKNTIVVSESGIQSAESIKKLKLAGISGALVGESLLKSKNREQLLKAFVEAGN